MSFKAGIIGLSREGMGHPSTRIKIGLVKSFHEKSYSASYFLRLWWPARLERCNLLKLVLSWNILMFAHITGKTPSWATVQKRKCKYQLNQCFLRLNAPVRSVTQPDPRDSFSGRAIANIGLLLITSFLLLFILSNTSARESEQRWFLV